MKNESYSCTRCGNSTFHVFRTGGRGAGPRFWHVSCSDPNCATIIMDVRNDSGSVIPLLSQREDSILAAPREAECG